MKPNFKFALIFTLFALICFTSCQTEAFEETQNQEQILEPNSAVASLMRSTSANNGYVDDIMDDANCFSVNLPVTIIANGITITIDSLEDLEILEEIFDEFNDDNDFVEFLFPIVIILNDYTEITIENEDQLEAFIEECTDQEDDVIECVEFVYPISFSIFNAEFDLLETVVIENDEQLYDFLENLGNPNDQALIVSLNFPVTMIYSNGETVEVHTNQELEAAINAAEVMCDDGNDNCEIDDINMYLLECHWELDSLNSNDISHIDFYFNENGSVQVKNTATDVVVNGNWETTVTDTGIVLTLSELTEFADDFNGDWLITECEEDELDLVSYSGANDIIISLERECENEIDCSAQEISHNLQECVWYGATNLYNTFAAEIFTFNENGTVSIESEGIVTSSGFWNIELTDEGVLLILDFDVEPNNLLATEWLIIECDEDRIKGVHGDNYVVFEQDCEVDNPFECFGSTELVKCDDDVADGFTEFNLELVYPNCPNDDVEVSFHASLGDAETDVEQLPTNYINTSNPQTIYARVALAGNNSVYEIFEVELHVEDCSPNDCSEEDVDGYLMECSWYVVNFNGSDDLIIYEMNFENDQLLTISGEGQTITAGWSTSQSANGVVVEFSNINGANIQAITGSWTIVECEEDRLEMVMENDFMVLERECN